MKYLNIFLLLLVLAIPRVSLATPVSWDFSGGILQPLQSMLTSLVRIPFLTATSATTTNLAVTSHLNLFGTMGTALSDFCVAITGGAGLCDGTDATGGGGGGSISTSSIPVAGNLSYWTSPSTLSDVATGTLTENVLGLDLDNSTRGLVGGSAIFSLTSGYGIPSTTRMGTWDAKGSGTVTSVDMSVPLGLSISGNPITNSGTLTVSLTNGYTIPSTTRATNWDTAFGWGNHALGGYDQVTTAGDGLTRTLNDFDCDTASGSTFGCLSSANWTTFNSKQDTITAGDALTLTGTDIDFDGGTVPAGALGGTWASPTVDDDGHNHTSLTLSGIDISADTNLAVDGTEIVKTDDTLSLGTSLTFTDGTSTNFDATNISLFGGGLKTTANALCQQLTGSADLCDGGDASGAGGGAEHDWLKTLDGLAITPTTTVGILVNASSTIIGALTVSSSSSATNHIFEVATSSDTSGDLFSVEATTTVLNSTSVAPTSLADSGTRVSVGSHWYMGMDGLIDQLVIHGRVRNPDWFHVECPIPVGATAVTSDTPTAAGITLCDGFDFFEDTTATLTNVSGSGFSYGRLGSAAATDGAGVFVRGLTGGWIVPATSTPSLEVTARIGTIVAQSTTTNYIIGFSNILAAGNTYENQPGIGCYFIASTTRTNWLARCSNGTATSSVDTGVSTTTNGVAAGGGGKFRTFRIDMDATQARFYIANGNTPALTLVGSLSTGYPATNNLNAGIHFGRTLGTQAVQFDFFGMDMWWRRLIPNN